jgi:hypothetical protein
VRKTTRKARKLLRDPFLFFADSALVKPALDALLRRRAQAGVRGQGDDTAVSSHEILYGNVYLGGRIDFALYFASASPSLYQVRQWLPALKLLAQDSRVVIVVRDRAVFRKLQNETDITICYCRRLNDLMAFYEGHEIRCIIYVNNAAKNFQSLINHSALHVHINHGESEKSCMHSNQAKAYDYVFVSADAALERYRRNLLKMDERAFVAVGRPQLDFIKPIDHTFPPDKKVVLYAPTWRATHTSMNYSSIGAFGWEIAEAILNHDEFYFVYRPHPAVGTTCTAEREADQRIKEAVEQSGNAALLTDGDINRIFPKTDIAIFDNSSVVVDYLKVDRPFFLTQVCDGGERAEEPPPIYQAAALLRAEQVQFLAERVHKELERDTGSKRRAALRRYYLGSAGEGESTRRFIEALHRIAQERDALLAAREQLASTRADGVAERENIEMTT